MMKLVLLFFVIMHFNQNNILFIDYALNLIVEMQTVI